MHIDLMINKFKKTESIVITPDDLYEEQSKNCIDSKLQQYVTTMNLGYLYDEIPITLNTDCAFYTACDLLNVDYSALRNELLYLIKGVKEKKIDGASECVDIVIKILSSHHPLLADETICNEIIEEIQEIIIYDWYDNFVTPFATQFQQIELIRDYVTELINGNKKLNNTNIFRYFCNTFTKKIIPEYLPPLGIPEDFSIQKFLEILDDVDDSFLNFSCDSVYEFLNANICSVLNLGLSFKLCKNCGKIFVPYHRSDTLYCDRKSPQDEHLTCKEYGAKRLWYENLKQNETKKLYRNIYMQKQMLSKRNPDIYSYQIDFENYKIQSQQWKSDVKSGLKTEEEYLDWLKSVRKRGAKNGQHNETE